MTETTAVDSISGPTPGMNRQWVLKTMLEPAEMFGEEHFDLIETPLPTIGDSEFLLSTVCLGTSPAQRAYITKSTSMHDKVNVGDVMRGRGIALVVDSNSAAFEVGDLVSATTGWQDFSVHDATRTDPFAARKIVSPVQPWGLSLGILGAAGVTAYFCLTDIAKAQPGNTVLVSAAAGGVGSCAVQIAIAMGCDVIGIAGGEKKCAWLRESLGVKDTIDYRADDLDEKIDAYCPNGVDVYFDNVGGDQLRAALDHLALGARIAICGYIATDYAETPFGPANYINLLRKRARMEGFFVFDYRDQFEAAERQLNTWYLEGKLVDNTDTLIGLETMPAALESLFSGGNTGVRICQTAPYFKHAMA